MPGKQLTFVDASVLIAAIKDTDLTRRIRAMAVLSDRQREFVATEFLRLETVPATIYRKERKEELFYQRFFKGVVAWVPPEALIEPAFKLMTKYPLASIDALHLAAAIEARAEFVSAEKPGKPFFQAYRKAFSIH